MRSLVLVFVLFLAPLGCAHTPPGGSETPSALVDCTVSAVRAHAIDIIPKVNDCIATSDYDKCLISLIQPAIGITIDAIGCAVQARGRSAARTLAVNQNDQLSFEAAARAEQFLKSHGFVFAEPASESKP
jgi:hypothetical protein